MRANKVAWESRPTWPEIREVTMTYGLHGNSDLLRTYGFVFPWLHNNTCLTEVALQPDTEPGTAYEAAFGIASEAETRPRDEELRVDACGKGLDEVLHIARALVVELEELPPAPDGSSVERRLARAGCRNLPVGCPRPLAMAPERRALQHVLGLLEAKGRALLRASGPATADEAILGAPESPSYREYVAAVVRRDEKVAIAELVALVRQSEAWLERHPATRTLAKDYIADVRWDAQVAEMRRGVLAGSG